MKRPVLRSAVGLVTMIGTAALILLPQTATSASTRSPVISISSPATGTTVAESVSVVGTAESRRKLVAVSVSLDGGAAQLATGTSSWRATVDLRNVLGGEHVITAEVRDASGARASARTTVKVTSPSPTSSPTPSPTSAPVKSTGTGDVRFMNNASSSFAGYISSPTLAQQQWMNSKYARMLAYSPYFDSRTRWYPNSWAYQDAYAIYTGQQEALVAAHPSWVLRDASGSPLFIPFGCANGTCPQYAADFGNREFRAWWITEARRKLAYNYVGLFIDDVNMDFHVSNVTGAHVAPVDPRTGATMTEANWRKYMAEFVEQVRLAFPTREIVHNALWWAGGTAADSDPYVARQLKAADHITLERGVNDGGITRGTGRFGYQRMLSYVDRRHAHGTNVDFLGYANDAAGSEYNLASYFLVNDGGDTVSSLYRALPDDWWAAYDIKLGAATGERYVWNGLFRRDFEGGLVLTNEPGAPQVTVTLPGTFRTTSGTLITSVTLLAGRGVVLRKA